MLIGLLGFIFVAAGLVLVPLPGPGWLIVLGGIAIWAVEFVWARRLLRFARDRLHRWNTWVRRQRRMVRLPLALALLAVAAVAMWLSLKHGLGIDPLEHVLGSAADRATGVDPAR